MKFAYFPGCSLKSTAREYAISCKAVSEILDIDLIEIEDWNCCGAMDAIYAYDPLLSLSLSARNLALAETMNLDVVTLCSACFFTLSRANKLFNEDSGVKSKVCQMLNEAGLKYSGNVRVRHYLDILVNDVGFRKISEHVKVPLKGLRVAPYYGCMLIRPPEIVNFDDPEHPTSLDKLIEALGGQSVDYIDKTRCCGASLGFTDEYVMMEMTKDILLNAKNAGAECAILPCPLCHFNLDAKQKNIESTFDAEIDLPVLYFTQLMGIAFGLSPKEVELHKNCVSPKMLLNQFVFAPLSVKRTLVV